MTVGLWWPEQNRSISPGRDLRPASASRSHLRRDGSSHMRSTNGHYRTNAKRGSFVVVQLASARITTPYSLSLSPFGFIAVSHPHLPTSSCVTAVAHIDQKYDHRSPSEVEFSFRCPKRRDEVFSLRGGCSSMRERSQDRGAHPSRQHDVS